MRKKETLFKNQSGIASMVVVILIMTILSLIVLSMTKNANREQRQALDRQLNTQAFYAAESGINDARDYYTKNANLTGPQKAQDTKTDCTGANGSNPGDQFPDHSSTVGDSVNSYTCVLYNATPDSLIYSNVNTSDSVLTPLRDAQSDKLNSLTFTWKRPNITSYDFSGCPTGGNLPVSLDATHCGAGVLRIELIDYSTSTAREDLINNDFVAYALPTTSGGTMIYNNGKGLTRQGVKVNGRCTAGVNGSCSLTISNINKTVLMLHLRSLYNENEVRVSAQDTSGDAVLFKNAQLMIDSTGRASDVLKRIQVRVPLNQYGNGVYPEFSLQTADSICKLMQIIPSSISSVQSTSDPACD